VPNPALCDEVRDEHLDWHAWPLLIERKTEFHMDHINKIERGNIAEIRKEISIIAVKPFIGATLFSVADGESNHITSPPRGTDTDRSGLEVPHCQ
jgi:hypothetical protein